MGRTSTAARWVGAAAIAAIVGLTAVGCSSTTDDPRTPGTSAVLGGSDNSASTTSMPTNSEDGIPSNGGSISEQRPPMGES